MKTFFTSDTHFGHNNILEYDKRPFSSIYEHDQAIISNWNKVVGKQNTIYHLGDFALCSEGHAEDKMEQLNGVKKYIRGNHCSSKMMKRVERHFEVLGNYHEVKIDGQMIVMCHYAFGTWNKSHRGSWNLYGHSHGSYQSKGKQKDVGINCNGYYPVEFEAIKLELDKVQLISVDHHKEK
jgi:calcineurin-like phosphoesterase family protein